MSRSRGFTLVELLVVIAIVGLLSTLAVIALSGMRERTRDTRRVSDMKNLYKAMELVKDEKGKYSFACNAVGNDTSGPTMVSNCSGLLSTYLPGLANFKDPVTPIGLCNPTTPVPCNYSFINVSTPYISANTWHAEFWLEKGTDNYAAGRHYVDQDGIH